MDGWLGKHVLEDVRSEKMDGGKKKMTYFCVFFFKMDGWLGKYLKMFDQRKWMYIEDG
jgi:hypothetical protein